MIEIKNRWTGELMHTVDAETVKDAVEKLVKRSANLSGADLSGADLSGAIKVPMYCKWTHGITDEKLIHIGCEKRTIEEWDVFFNSDEKIETERGTPEFKQIQAVYNAYKAYLQTINQ